MLNTKIFFVNSLRRHQLLSHSNILNNLRVINTVFLKKCLFFLKEPGLLFSYYLLLNFWFSLSLGMVIENYLICSYILQFTFYISIT